MILPIYIYGSPVLRRKAAAITPDYPELQRFLESMWETMYQADGVGLAAPQTGHGVRVMVVDIDPGSGEASGIPRFKKAMINPEIYEYFGEESLSNEGCLSIPGIHEDVIRPEGIRVRYLDENFAAHDEKFSGYPARVIQHEYDHLEGKMFVDRVSPLRKTLLAGKLRAMAKGKYEAAYPCKLVKKEK